MPLKNEDEKNLKYKIEEEKSVYKTYEESKNNLLLLHSLIIPSLHYQFLLSFITLLPYYLITQLPSHITKNFPKNSKSSSVSSFQ